MKKYLPILLLTFACKSEIKSPRAEIARQQTELKAEHKRLNDSLQTSFDRDRDGMADSTRERIAFEEGRVMRRLTFLKMKSDSLSAAMKAFELDSIAKSR